MGRAYLSPARVMIAPAIGWPGDFLTKIRTACLGLVGHVIAQLDASEGQALIDRLLPHSCRGESDEMRLLEAMADRNGPAIVEAAAAVRHGVEDGDVKYLVEAEMYGHLLQGNPAANINLWRTLPNDIQKDVLNNLPIRLMLAHSGWTPDRLE